jgi:hypothetical protein
MAEAMMVEIPTESGDGKLVVMGADLADLVMEVHLGAETRRLSGLSEASVRRMRQRADNAGKGFLEDFQDGNLLLLESGNVSLGLAALHIDFQGSATYTEVRNGAVVITVEKRADRALSKPISLVYLDDTDPAQVLVLSCDCFMMRKLAEALADYLP